MDFLPDINYWLALMFDQHPSHASATTWFAAMRKGSCCLFCRYTQMGFLRLTTNRQSNRLQTQTMSQAWVVYEQLLLDTRVLFVTEPPGLEGHWRNFTQLPSFSPNVWNDAYLAAFAIAGGYEIVTFDRGFSQFPGLKCTILT